ncbi:MAG: hypothetical protein Q8Q74_11545, partial [Polaromonas sp.]|nr:hypothetical protein [Polaromonas sp.]
MDRLHKPALSWVAFCVAENISMQTGHRAGTFGTRVQRNAFALSISLAPDVPAPDVLQNLAPISEPGFDCRCQTVCACQARAIDSPMKKASKYRYLEAFVRTNGRCERIRTFDPLHPMQVRY